MYDAFLSYSHARDKELAKALKSGLQRLACPWYRRRALHAYLDDSNLSATPRAWGSIESALDDSRYLVLLASPEAAKSPWVEREVRHWTERERTERLLIVLTAGEIVWSDDRRDGTGSGFDWERTSALPSALEGVFAEEPLWVDLRKVREEGVLSARNPAFQHALARLSAPIRGETIEELIGRDVREHRRRLVLALAAGVAIAAVAGVALWQYTEAESARAREVTLKGKEREQRLLAERRLIEKKESLARAHVAEAAVHTDAGRTDLAFEKVAAAHVEDSDVAPLSSVVSAFGRTGSLIWENATPFEGFTGRFRAVADGRVIVGPSDGDLVKWDVLSGRVLSRFEADASGILEFASSDDGARVAVERSDGTVGVFDWAAAPRQIAELAVRPVGLQISTNGRYLTFIDSDDVVRVFDADNGTETCSADVGLEPAGVFFTDAKTVCVVDMAGGIHRLSVEDGTLETIRDPREEGEDVDVVAAPRSGWIGLDRGDSHVEVVSVTTGKVRAVLTGDRVDDAIWRAAVFAPDGGALWVPVEADRVIRRLALDGGEDREIHYAPSQAGILDYVLALQLIGAEDALLVSRHVGTWSRFDHFTGPALRDARFRTFKLTVVDPASGERMVDRTVGYDATPTTVAYRPDGRFVAVGLADGDVALLDARDGSLKQQYSAHEGPVTDMAFLPDGRRLITSGEDGALVVSSPESGAIDRKIGTGAGRITALTLAREGRLVVAAGAPEPEAEFDPSVPEQLKEMARQHAALVIRLADDRVLARLEGPIFPVVDLAATPDGSRVLGTSDAYVVRWHLPRVLDGEGDDPIAISAGAALQSAFCHDVQIGNDGTLSVALATGVVVSLNPDSLQAIGGGQVHDGPAGLTRMNRAGSFVLSGEGRPVVSPMQFAEPEIGEIRLVDPATWVSRHRLGGHMGGVHDAALGPDGREAVSVGADGRVRMWDLRVGARRHDTAIHDVATTFLAVAGDGVVVSRELHFATEPERRDESLVVASDPLGLRELAAMGECDPFGEVPVAVSPDGRHAARTIAGRSQDAAGPETRFEVWSLESGERVASVPIDADVSTRTTRPIGFSADGSLAWAIPSPLFGKTEVPVVDVASGRVRNTLTFEDPEGVLVRADGERGFVIDDRLKMRPFGPDGTGEPLANVRAVDAILTKDERWCVALDTQGAVIVIEPDAGAVVRTIPGTRIELIAPCDHPDEFLSADLDGRVALWSAATGRLIWSEHPGTGAPLALAGSLSNATATVFYEPESGQRRQVEILELDRPRLAATHLADRSPEERLAWATQFAARHRKRGRAVLGWRWRDAESPRPAAFAGSGLEAPASPARDPADGFSAALVALRDAFVTARALRAAEATGGTPNREADEIRQRLRSGMLRQRPPEALEEASKLLALVPDDPTGWIWTAIAHRDLSVADPSPGRSESQARAGIRAAELQKDPQLVRLAAAHAAEGLAACGAHAAAVPYYRMATENLNDPILSNNINLWGLTNILVTSARYDEALTAARRHTEIEGLSDQNARGFEDTIAWLEFAAELQRTATRLPLVFFWKIEERSPAWEAGLRPGDALLEIDGRIHSVGTTGPLLTAAMSDVRTPNQPKELLVLRGGEEVRVDATKGVRGAFYWTAHEQATWVVRVTEVMAGSPAAGPDPVTPEARSIQSNDVLWAINGVRIRDQWHFYELWDAGQEGERMVVTLRRFVFSPAGDLVRDPDATSEALAEDPLAAWVSETWDRHFTAPSLGLLTIDMALSPPR